MSKKNTQVRTLPSRTCTKKSYEYVEFFPSDSEGSDFEDDTLEELEISDDEGETYDAINEGQEKYDERKGKDSWVGRRIVKTFGEHGDFEGIVYGVDTDANKPGYRLFMVHYFDDPEDGEEMWPEELVRFDACTAMFTTSG